MGTGGVGLEVAEPRVVGLHPSGSQTHPSGSFPRLVKERLAIARPREVWKALGAGSREIAGGSKVLGFGGQPALGNIESTVRLPRPVLAWGQRQAP